MEYMWRGDTYFYSKRTLRTIADNYCTIYDGLPFSLNREITNNWSLAEFKGDFDMALNGIGKGKWLGPIDGYKFKDYKHYSRLQQVIIASITGMEDSELEQSGFWDIPKFRSYAYFKMCQHLNGE